MKNCLLIAGFSMIAIWSAAEAAITNVTTVGVTATQAVISYTAPDNNPCRIVVSESSGLIPPVHDVDPALFPGAESDTRPGNIASGPTRVIVLGKRLADTHAADGRTYSRALQTNTKHYYRISCGGDQAMGSFTTANIPLGMTYNDVPQPDSDHPGQWAIPTQIQDRSQTIIDPQTGALLHRVSLDAEQLQSYYNGAYLTKKSSNRVCSNTLTGPVGGPRGYLCSLWDYNGGPNLIYFIVPDTGEVRYLGALPYGLGINGADLSLYVMDDVQWVNKSTYLDKTTYTGNFDPSAGMQLSASAPYSSISANALMKQFDSSFDDTLFTCDAASAQAGSYALIRCRRSVDGSYGWMGILYGGDGRVIAPGCTAGNACPRVVAAVNVIAAPPTRWCALAHADMVPGSFPMTQFNLADLNDFTGSLGLAPMATTLAADIMAAQTSITVMGEPVSTATAGDPFRQDAAVGDVFHIGTGPTEDVQIVAITPLANGQRSWQLARTNAQAFPAGTVIWAACKAGPHMNYWKFQNDPHGADTTNSNVVIDYYWDGGWQWDYGAYGRVTSGSIAGWQAVPGPIMSSLNQPLSLTIDDSPPFAGAIGKDSFTTTRKNASLHQDPAQTPLSEQRWFLDMMPFNGGPLFSPNPGVSLVSGQLYKYLFLPDSPLSRKQLPTLASNGAAALVDISGPGSVISDQASDSYKYCVANVAGECRAGSAAGDAFINSPDVRTLLCLGEDGPVSNSGDVCLGNAGAYVQSLAQIYLGADAADSTAHSRTLTHGLGGLKALFYFSMAKSLPNASWALFNAGVVWHSDGLTNVWMAKIPPLVAQDSLDRTTFLPLTLNLKAPPLVDAGAIDNAVVQFGYEEQGAPDQYFCTSRREICEAVTATIDAANPFFYEKTELHSGMPCAGGNCTITVPVLPMHTVHFQVLFRDSKNATLAVAKGVSAELSAKALEGVQSPTPTTSAGISAVKVYPNPWRQDKHAGKNITFDGLSPGATLKIFTVSARLVKELSADGASVTWDLQTDKGEMAASGIYIFQISDGQGGKTRGKFGLIR